MPDYDVFCELCVWGPVLRWGRGLPYTFEWNDVRYAVKELGRRCFERDSVLTSIVVPEGITVIDTSTFADNYALRRVHLPSTLQIIKYHGFNECMAIDTITLACTTPPTVADSAIDDYSATLIVPCNTANTYRQHEVWGQFANIVDNCDGIEDVESGDFNVYVRDGRIVVDGADGETVRVYNMMGRQVASRDLTNGVYLVKVGDSAARKVVVY